MRIVPVNVLSDNFSYLLIDDENKLAAAVDPVEPKKVLKAAEKEGITKITHILTTHHHSDHAGGNKEMVELLGKDNVEVLGYDDNGRIEALSRKVTDGETFKIGNIGVKTHYTPCHTTNHVLYEVSDKDDKNRALFTGDTLFIGGCGRFFEGNAQQMFHALTEVIGNLPKDTKIYCGHEYTVKNLQFALTIEPNNKAARGKLEWAQMKRSNNENTVPSTVEEELSFNPFMRTFIESVAEGVGMKGSSSIDVMAELRKRKDTF